MELNEASIKKPQSSTGGQNAATAPAIAASSSLLYLEDIHIFGLANMLQRPIVVIALEKLQNIQPIHLRGIYLPVLAQNVNTCVRDPIVIAFHRYHFVPLVAASDEDEHEDNKKQRSASSAATPLKYTSRYYEFENVDRTDFDAIRYDDDEYGYRSSKPFKTLVIKLFRTSQLLCVKLAL